ncbi:MAG: response regulator, partial [Eubacterium sp.]|nr:response regulator [Eubacterium sp.]
EEDLKDIFGIFNQVNTRKNRHIAGTGLGLAISKNLAELMGGDITVDSVYGEGSTFHITLRQKVTEYKQMGEQVANSLEEKRYLQSVREKQLVIEAFPDAKVLIVDDIRVNLVVAKGVMKPYQMQIDTASSGKDAIELVKANDYDIIFMDHMMPELDGIDTTHLIRELDDGKYMDLPIIALTANAVGEAREMFISEGLQDFLAKPIDKKELDAVIHRWLK